MVAGKFKFVAERGCVEDQPRRLRKFDHSRIVHVLRLTLRAQPRSVSSRAYDRR